MPQVGGGKGAPAQASPLPRPVAPPARSPAPVSTSPVVPPPSFSGGGSAVPPPSFGMTPQAVAPPPFMQEEEEEPEDEVVRVEKVVEIGYGEVAESEVGRVNVAPYAAVAATLVLAGLFGYIAGGQIDRAVRANRAIDGALAIHEAVVRDQEMSRGLKSRISGAARKAIDPTDPAADFELLDYLVKARRERPFTAKVWSGEFYQSFKAAPLLFEYYRSIQILWDLVDDMGVRYEEASARAALKAWPADRTDALQVVSTEGTSGYAVAFRDDGGKVLALLGTFHNARRESDKGVNSTKAEFRLLGESAEKTLSEYSPGTEAPLSDGADGWYIQANPVPIIGPKREVVNHAGPYLAEKQEAYRQYLSDLNDLSQTIQAVQGNQDNLIQALAEIRGARRPFTFGF